jgi:hypothetical protein
MYHQAFVGTLPEVKDLLEECDRIERENEALAGASSFSLTRQLRLIGRRMFWLW